LVFRPRVFSQPPVDGTTRCRRTIRFRAPHLELARRDQVLFHANGVRGLDRHAEVIGPCFLMGFGLDVSKRSNCRRRSRRRPTPSKARQQQANNQLFHDITFWAVDRFDSDPLILGVGGSTPQETNKDYLPFGFHSPAGWHTDGQIAPTGWRAPQVPMWSFARGPCRAARDPGCLKNSAQQFTGIGKRGPRSCVTRKFRRYCLTTPKIKSSGLVYSDGFFSLCRMNSNNFFIISPSVLGSIVNFRLRKPPCFITRLKSFCFAFTRLNVLPLETTLPSR